MRISSNHTNKWRVKYILQFYSNNNNNNNYVNNILQDLSKPVDTWVVLHILFCMLFNFLLEWMYNLIFSTLHWCLTEFNYLKIGKKYLLME